MARIVQPLKNTQISNAKAGDKDQSLYDGDGLLLLIKPTGIKIWRFRYYKPLTKKRTTITFGNYPALGLADARRMRESALSLLAQGIDPQEHKQEALQNKLNEKQNTFEFIASEWFKVKSSENLKEKTLRDVWRSLENHVFPYIGKKPIKQITAIDAIKALEPLRSAGKFEAIKRACQRINEIMNYAMNVGILNINPTTKITAAFETSKTQHRPTIKPDELPAFMSSLAVANIELQTRCLIEWQLLTMTRPGEATGAKWQEIDLNNRLWIIPPERMKMSREHQIPLSSQALVILEILKPITGHREHIFPSMKSPFNKPMNSSTINMAIKRMGYKGVLVAHGLRALASTTLNSQGFDPDVIEAALAHSDKNTVRKAYNRATYVEQRRIMMDWWGNFIEEASKGNVSLSGNRALKAISN